MEELRLLVVEDDSLDDYKRRIKSFNLDSDMKIHVQSCNNYGEAVQLLGDSGNSFDAAIVDLKLSSGVSAGFDGLKIIETVKSGLRFPVYVLTGNPEAIENQKDKQSDFFQIRTKGEEAKQFEKILSELIAIHQTGITKILGGKGLIENYLQNIFWNHLSNSVNYWVSDKHRSSEEKQQSLLRYTLLHIQEYLDLNKMGESSAYHPAEFYITKPVKTSLHTGDIISWDDSGQSEYYVVLNPACDFEVRKGKRNAERILLLRIKNWVDLDSARYGALKPDTDKDNPARSSLSGYLTNAKPRFHFTPKSNNLPGGLIDFQDKITVPFSTVEKEIADGVVVRRATISSPFLKDVIARYSSYYARQGSPDFDSNELYDSLFK